MYNNAIPDATELPSARKLLRSTLIALAVASALLVTIVLPAEYAIDPTGVGRMLGLTQMGEIKAQLAREAAADATQDDTDQAVGTAATAVPPVAPVAAVVPASPPPVQATASEQAWEDQMQVVLQPGQGAEIKLVMKAGEKAEFGWTVQGGAVNFDTHGDGGGKSISYEKGRTVPADDGVLVAAFDGNHGWFWRNRGHVPVTVMLRVRGDYQDIKRLI